MPTIALLIWVAIAVVLLCVYLAHAAAVRIAKPVLKYSQIRGESMSDMLTYTISAAPVVDSDVVSRVLTVSISGEEPSERTLPGSAVDFGQLTVAQDVTVTLTLVDVDDAGNKSEPAVVEFVAADTLPPGQPGGLGVTLVGENLPPNSDS